MLKILVKELKNNNFIKIHKIILFMIFFAFSSNFVNKYFIFYFLINVSKILVNETLLIKPITHTFIGTLLETNILYLCLSLQLHSSQAKPSFCFTFTVWIKFQVTLHLQQSMHYSTLVVEAQVKKVIVTHEINKTKKEST